MLRENGHRVRGLSRSAADPERRAPDAEALFAWDASTTPPPPDAFEGVDAVLHLAGEPVVGRWTASKKRTIRESRVESTKLLVDGMRAAVSPPTRFVCASAIGFYGDRHEQVIDETSEPGDDFLAEVCTAWEAAARTAPESVGVSCVRIGIVLGRGGGALEAMLTPFRLGLGGSLGSGKQWWSWIHLDDAAGVLQHALTVADPSPAMNATSPNPVRQETFARLLARALRRPAILPAPAFALRLALGEFSRELLTSKRVYPRRTEASGYTFRYPELEGALESLLPSD
jgi:uncharacterized protein (TIGR01777 family)